VRALPYLVASGDAASRAYATSDAIGYYSRALDILKDSPDMALARRAYEGLGNALNFANEFARAVETYQQMLALAETSDGVALQVSALNKLAFVVALRLGQFPDAERALADAEKLARTYDDKRGLSELSTIRCMMCTAAADFDSVLRYMGEAISLGRELDVKEQLAMGLGHIANTQVFMTRFAEAAETAQEALHLAREIGDRQREAEVLGMAIALCNLGTGNLDDAQYAAAQGRNIGAQIGAAFPLIIGGWVLGEIVRLRGDYEQAVNQHERALQFAKPTEQVMAFLTAQPLASLGSTYVEFGGEYAARGYELHSQALKLLDTPSGLSAGGTAWADIGFSALAGAIWIWRQPNSKKGCRRLPCSSCLCARATNWDWRWWRSRRRVSTRLSTGLARRAPMAQSAA
jgi:tetratricopeptide (TPR) repeat protein